MSSTITLPGYDQIVLVGEGGLGRVYRAVRLSTGGVVAIKELRDIAEASPAWRRAVREVEAMLRLKGHPCVVSVEEIVQGPNGPCIVMEYMAGGSLFDRLQHGPLSTAEVVLVGHQVAQALSAAHSVGVIHRDVKPHNILVGGFGQVKIGDFGIAAVIRESGQRTQTQALTLAYASPEELDGSDDVGPAADVYSLAATLGHLATGRKPSFRERTPPEFSFEEQAAMQPVADVLRAGLATEPSDRPTMARMVAVFDMAAAALGPSKILALGPPEPISNDEATVARATRSPAQPSGQRDVQEMGATAADSATVTRLAQVTTTTPAYTVSSPVHSSPSSPTPHPRKGSNRGALIGGVVGAVAALVVTVAVLAVRASGGEEDTVTNVPSVNVTTAGVESAPRATAVATTALDPTSTVELVVATSVPAITQAVAVPVTPVAATAAPSTVVPAIRVVELNCNYCRLRSQPTTAGGSAIVAEFSGSKGARVDVLADGVDGWLWVRVESQTGWLFGTFVWPVPAGFLLAEQDSAIVLLDAAGTPLGIDNPTGDKALVTSTTGPLLEVLLPDGTIAYVNSSTPIRR